MNLVVINGNLVKDPFVGKNGVVAITVANNEYAGKNKDKAVTFVDCLAFQRTGENIAKYFEKGKPILVRGRLVESTKTKGKLILIIDGFDFVGSAKTEKEAPKEQTKDGDEDMPF